MTKLEAWKAWHESLGIGMEATEHALEKGSHGKAFSYAWDAAVKAEREACAKENAELLQALQNLHQRCHWADAPEEMDAAKAAIEKAIRARGEV